MSRMPRHIEIMGHDQIAGGVVVTWFVDRVGQPRQWKTLSARGSAEGTITSWGSEREARDGHQQTVARMKAMH